MILTHTVHLDTGEAIKVTVQHSAIPLHRSADKFTVEVVFPRGEKVRQTLQEVVAKRAEAAAWSMRRFRMGGERAILYLPVPRTGNEESIRGLLDELFPVPEPVAPE